MRNIKLVIAYDGTSFSGWQRQSKQPTIQGIIENSIKKMIGKQIAVHGAGRTDAGVHAIAMVANFQSESNIPCEGFHKGLNSILPDDIRITSVQDVKPDFHSRFNAKGKLYEYNFITSSTILPTERLYNTHVPSANALAPSVSACLEAITGEHDFSTFEATGSRDCSRKGGLGAVRKILKASLIQKNSEGDHFAFQINGNGFLRHMVRNIAGTLFEVASGKRSDEEFIAALKGCDRALAGPTAPSSGLFLKEVYY